jgi:glycosyltransferase involved in cell wall biosynthesis
MDISYSFIIPVYNRPQEIEELLESFLQLDYSDTFEIVIIEDGSSQTSESVVEQCISRLNISYFYKDNSGPGASRNYGMQRAQGNYFIILDSDCLLPPSYLKTVDQFLQSNFYHCFGGADAAHASFSSLQKAINYVMTSFLTTGGIRGSKKSISSFEPRSFNMGLSKEAFIRTNGFGKIHPGEDPDLSQRLLKSEYQTTFIPNAAVFHKRRISWNKFYIQVKKFGSVRPILNLWHPNSAKITYWLPTLFVLFTVLSLLFALMFHWMLMIPLLLYLAIIFVDCSYKNKNMLIGTLAVLAILVQFFGYGIAFLKSTYYIRVLKKDPEKQFPNLFFK